MTYTTINSLQNPFIKKIAKLSVAQERYLQKRYCAEGMRVCTTIIKAGHVLEQCYILEEHISQIATLVAPEKITIVSRGIMQKISNAHTPSGIICIFVIPPKTSLDMLQPGLVLANITDPGNMGTLIRSSIAMNKKIITVIGGVDIWNPKVIQASAGTIAQATLIQCSWQELIQAKKSYILCGLVVAQGDPLETAKPQNALLIIGNEAHGLPLEWQEQCDQLITLTMPGDAESLNAGVAGSIAAYMLWHNDPLLL